MIRAMLLGALSSALTFSGCSLTRVELTAKDAGQRQVSHDANTSAELDAGAELDANLPPVDAFVPIDMGMMEEDDAGLADSGPLELRTCGDIYGEPQNFILCEESERECVFYAVLEGASCAEACASKGGGCIETFDNGPLLLLCTPASEPLSCDTRRVDHICVCNRIP